MGMSTHVVGFIPADEKWKKMLAIWEACEAGGVGVPEEVEDYFGGESPVNKPGMEVDLGDACKEWNSGGEFGYQVDVTKLPEGVRYIRVYNSW